MYYEKPAKKKGKADKEETTPRYVNSTHGLYCVSEKRCRHRDSLRSMEDHVIREGERDTFVKLTYSAFRSDDSDESTCSTTPAPKAPFSKSHDKEAKKPRKWHLSKLPSLPRFSCFAPWFLLASALPTPPTWRLHLGFRNCLFCLFQL